MRAGQSNLGNRLGSLAKLRLGGALKGQLTETGYDEQFFDTAMEHLVAGVTNEPK